jgi:hypothetical protein
MMKWLMAGLLGMSVGFAHAADMTALRYVDQDPGDPPYLTRILVTPDFMRIDGGDDDGDFVLLDRRKRKVINVMHGNKMALVFSPGALPPKPAGWKPRLAVRNAARGTQHFSLTLDGVVCSEGIAALKAAPDAARAMTELKSVLAAMHYRVWKESPPALQHPCELANQVWEFGMTLNLGLPLEERDFAGRTRKYESETRERLRPGLFKVPDGMPVGNAPS